MAPVRVCHASFVQNSKDFCGAPRGPRYPPPAFLYSAAKSWDFRALHCPARPPLLPAWMRFLRRSRSAGCVYGFAGTRPPVRRLRLAVFFAAMRFLPENENPSESGGNVNSGPQGVGLPRAGRSGNRSPSGPFSEGSVAELGPNGGVVRGLLALALFPVDLRLHQPLHQRRGGEDVIDAHTQVLGERQAPVIPPAELLLHAGVQLAERVRQPEGTHLLQRVALLQREERLPLPDRRVVHIDGLGGHVPVPTQHQRLIRRVPRLQVAPQPRVPFQLVHVGGRVHRLSVGHIGAHHANPAHRRRDEPRMGVLHPIRQAQHHVRGLCLREDGHPVVGLLPVRDGVVARLADRFRGEVRIHALQLLEAEDVRLVGLQPVQQALLPRPDRVHIPAGDFHRAPPSHVAHAPSTLFPAGPCLGRHTFPARPRDLPLA
ncbi:hypothetical protein STIAU_1064 [Stigmatella aurantiaca DW4/3-1]|uniref:Uncharacterized protein n=1 Tax=Stigmatella aurantiaca (strain DW4/3-1) TaxID=378806 RepID=Q091G2_STIAD|nr:hypothetical protein STIAU_1064 [Stigmatella aurantiaca DW4/3-1]